MNTNYVKIFHNRVHDVRPPPKIPKNTKVRDLRKTHLNKVITEKD